MRRMSIRNLNTADDIHVATEAYAVGNWYLVNGDPTKARAVFDRVLEGKAWTALGYIAAEAGVARGF